MALHIQDPKTGQMAGSIGEPPAPGAAATVSVATPSPTTSRYVSLDDVLPPDTRTRTSQDPRAAADALFAQRDALNKALIETLAAGAADELPDEVTSVVFDNIDGYVNSHGLTIERYEALPHINGTPISDLYDEDPDKYEHLEVLAFESPFLTDIGYILAERGEQPGFTIDLTQYR